MPRASHVHLATGVLIGCLLASWGSTQSVAIPAAIQDAPAGPQRDLQKVAAALHDVEDLLNRAAAPDASDVPALLSEASRRLEEITGAHAGANAGPPRGSTGSTAKLADPLSTETRADLTRIAGELRAHAASHGRQPGSFPARKYVDEIRRLEERVKEQLKASPDLAFQGSYSQPRVQEPAYGGHASAMGPPPVSAGSFTVSTVPQFEDVSSLPIKTYGGGRTKDHLLESGGSGIALLDYDGDGLLDIYVVNAFELTDARERIPHRNALYRNLGGWKFQDVSAAAGVDRAAWGNGVCAGDFNDDGYLDLYVTNFGANFLFRNNGDGTFTEVAQKAGVQAGGWSTGCTFFDADGDGHLDLYVARYVHTTWDDVTKALRLLTWRGGPKVMVGPVGLPGEADLFFHNRGDGTFEDATDAAGLTDTAKAYGFGVLATDYDGDGSVDLFVANDTNPNFLYHNRGGGRFESVGFASGVAVNAEGRTQAGMGVDAGDYDGDGRLDLIVTNFAHDTNTLYRNIDGTHFEDATVASGLAAAKFVPMGWGVGFFDADLDGKLDLFFANGHIYPQVDDFPQLQESYRQKNQLLLNLGGRFVDVSARAGPGLQVQKSSRGLAIGDLDNDGSLDLVISNMDDTPTLLANRQRSGHHWVGFKLEKSGANRFCIGARVTLHAGGQTQIREVRSGGSYLSQNDLRAHFGLGSYSGTVDVDAQMPGGRQWHWKALPIDRYTTLTLQGEGEKSVF
jgi:enediyne biosynthesis protein E4